MRSNQATRAYIRFFLQIERKKIKRILDRSCTIAGEKNEKGKNDRIEERGGERERE